MTEIRDAGSTQYTNTNLPKIPPKKAEEGIESPKDEVVISKPKQSLARKIVRFPGKVLGAAVGGVTAAASAPLHIIPGAVKGIQEGLASRKGRGKEGLFHFTMWAQNLAIGAGAGMMMGGPVGAAIGAGAAVVFSGVNTFIGERSGAYEKMIEKVEARVDKAVEDNVGNRTKVVVQSAVEGSIIGGGEAFTEGGKVGYQAGKGIVEGAFAGVEGIVEGVYEGVKGIITSK
ncbi:MAG: hypothetical protein K8T10_12245 [Candidatus Eremiobacteraeota bacterium]|nr:hypothetical protein [Candidatus Eremiobacteraeota bacterium]